MSENSKIKGWVCRHSTKHEAGFLFWCPACEQTHTVRTEGEGSWGWNGSEDKPTFTPSVLVTWSANPNASEGFKEWRTERRCHSFVTDGRIQYLSDCTHGMANQTIDMMPIPKEHRSY